MLFVANIPASRQWVTQTVASALSEKIESRVEIGDIEFGLSSHMSLSDVRIYDRKDSLLLGSRRISAKIDYLPLLRGRISFGSIALLDGHVTLYKETEGTPANFQFVIDAFKSKKKKEKTNIDLRINSLILRRCKVSYDALYLPKKEQFQLSHLNVGNINVNISLKELTRESLNLRIRSMSFEEASGLKLKGLSMRVKADTARCEVSHLALTMPQSHVIAKEKIVITYDANDIVGTLRTEGRLSDVALSTDDVLCFVPRLKGLKQVFRIKADWRVSPRAVEVRELDISENGRNLNLRADVEFGRQMKTLDFVAADIKEMGISQNLIGKSYEAFSRKPLPAVAGRVGDVNFTGKLLWHTDSLQRSSLNGTIGTGIGELKADFSLLDHVAEGSFVSATLLIQHLDSYRRLPENLVFNAKTKINFKERKNLLVGLEAQLDRLTYREYEYADIRLKGEWRNKGFKFEISSPDPNCMLLAKGGGQFNKGRLTRSELNLDLRNFVPQRLHLTDYFGSAEFASNLHFAAKGTSLENLTGELALHDFRLYSPEGNYHMEALEATLRPTAAGSRLEVEGDLLTLFLEGHFSVPALKSTAQLFLSEHFDGFEKPDDERAASDTWRMRFKLNKSDFFSKVCRLPLELKGDIHGQGNLRADGERMSVSLHTDGVTYNKGSFDDIRFYLDSDNFRSHALVQMKKRIAKSDVQFVVKAENREGKLHTSLELNDGEKKRFYGSLSTQAGFLHDAETGSVSSHLDFLPTTFTMNDTVWSIASGQADITSSGLGIRNFLLGHGDRSLAVDGRFSKDERDSLLVKLRNLDIAYFLGMTNFRAVDFAGTASGNATIRIKDKKPELKANLLVDDLSLNEAVMGDADIKAWWNNEAKSIDLDADIVEKGVARTLVEGYVSPAHKELELKIKAENTNVGLLNRYTASIFSGLEGRATGNLRLFGKFQTLDFEGDMRADLKAKVVYTGVTYDIRQGQLSIVPGRFIFKNVEVTDLKRGVGHVNGFLSHEYLKNLCYELDMTCENMLCYDMPKEVDGLFYSTTYGTGSIQMRGKPGSFYADISLHPEQNTTFVYSLDGPASLSDGKLLTYAESKSEKHFDEEENSSETPAVPAASSDVVLNFLVDVTPKAKICVIMDEKAGDDVNVTGSGTIRASYYNKGDFKLYGTYTVERGLYKFSVQNVIRKDFEIQSGSKLSFPGNPLDGEVDITAHYTVPSVSLSDLNMGSGLMQNSTPVVCILKLDGKVSAPQITFDLDLPKVNEDEKQMVRNLITSEDDMNMQILYLLGIGRFYTYNYASSAMAQGQSQSATAVNSFLSGTLSSQLNDIISSAMNSSNWSFGTNLSTGVEGWNDVEVMSLLSGRLLNNRLIINGNFGYRDRSAYTSTTNNFVGDFDIRYLLTPSGSVSLKAYSETNDRYFTKSSLTTQGIGLQLSRDFSSLRELFKINRKKKRKAASASE